MSTRQAELTYRNRGNSTLLQMLGRPGRLLDCGCGAGDNAEILQRRGWRVVGITIDPDEQAAAADSCEGVVIADLEDGLPVAVGDNYDAILMSHVLEHLARPSAVLAAAHSRLTAAGVVAVALPNVLHYRQRLRFVAGDFTYTDTGPLDRTHLRFYTVQTARELLTEAGFEVIRSGFEGGLPWMGLRRIFPAGLLRRVDNWALQRWPGLLAWQVLFIARSTAGPR